MERARWKGMVRLCGEGVMEELLMGLRRGGTEKGIRDSTERGNRKRWFWLYGEGELPKVLLALRKMGRALRCERVKI